MTNGMDSRTWRRALLTLSTGLWLAGQAVLPPAMAQDFPARPVRVVVPYSAGGPVDMMARAVSKYMANVSGQSNDCLSDARGRCRLRYRDMQIAIHHVSKDVHVFNSTP